LDGKADVILRTAGAIAPVLVAALTLFKAAHPGWWAPSGFCIGLSLILAALCRKPIWQRTPPSIKDFVEDVGNYENIHAHRLDAHLAAALHCADVARDVINGWKSRQMEAATRLLCIGIVLLAIPFYLEATSPTVPAATGSPPAANPAVGACSGQKAP
jgi:hypothetical protein